MTEIRLSGCSPEPLMMNIKALGIFRVIAEQKDPGVMAYWKNDVFVLSTKLTEDELVDFFLNEYRPTPIIAPWNNGSGFYEATESNVDKILRRDDDRLREYRDTFENTKKILVKNMPQYSTFVDKKDKKSSKEVKNTLSDDVKKLLLVQFRNNVANNLIPWLDAAYVVGSGKPSYGAVLGTGGNDGNFEISYNYMGCVVQCINDSGDKEWIKGSLFGSPSSLTNMSSAYFYPEGYKGPNCSNDGIKQCSLMNPWDYVLMVEGTMLFAGSVSRRSVATSTAFPFTVKSSTAGYATSSDEDHRGEIWIPLWDNPATYPEIRYVFNEGRSQIGIKRAKTGCDFARALVSLGVQRGISGFQRFGLLERKGQAYLASNIGRINVTDNTNVNLFTDIDDWLNKIRNIKNIPNSTKSLLDNIDDAIIKYCMYKKPSHIQEVLVVLGKIETAISNSTHIRKTINPLQYLSSEWISACYDETPEFRLALSLASMSYKSKYPIRFNLEQVKKPKYKIEWVPQSSHAVWNQSDTIQNMIAVLERRCLDASISHSPISLGSDIPAPLSDVLAFIDGRVDYKKIGNLLLPLSMIDYNDSDNKLEYLNSRKIRAIPEFIPESYVLIKSNFLPVSFTNKPRKFESSIIPLLKSGNIHMATKVARRRLYIQGTNISIFNDSNNSSESMPKSIIDKLTAAVLFPLSGQDAKEIIGNITTKQSIT